MSERPAQYIRLAGGQIGLRQFRPAQPQRTRLICLPHAGGQSLAFRPLARHLPEDWGVWAVDPPGHGFAQGDLLDDVEVMSASYATHLPGEVIDGGILLGHSLGGCVAYALARRLEAGGRGVSAVVVCATPPPEVRAKEQRYSQLDDEALLAKIVEIGGVPANWAAERELFALFKHTIRADLSAYEKFEIGAPLSETRLLALGAVDDEICRPEHLRVWSNYADECHEETFPGGHLFLQSHAEPFARRFAELIDQNAAAGAREREGRES